MEAYFGSETATNKSSSQPVWVKNNLSNGPMFEIELWLIWTPST